MKFQNTDSYSRSFVEILTIINHMEEKYREMIPSKLLNFFEENKDPNYFYDLNDIKDINTKVFSDETIGLLSMIEFKYWTQNSEKEILNNALVENEKKFQMKSREKYNPDIFLRDEASKIVLTEDYNAMEEYKEPFFIKIKKWFWRTF